LEWKNGGLTGDEVGLTLAEGKDLFSELQRLVLQTQMDACPRLPGVSDASAAADSNAV
jgi:hypothetical protein